MTTYLDDAWIETEQRHLDQLKQQLLDGARLLEQAATSVPELTRQLEQLHRTGHEWREQLSAHAQAERQAGADQASAERATLDALTEAARSRIDDHLQSVIADLDHVSQAGSLIALQRSVHDITQRLEEQRTAHQRLAETSAQAQDSMAASQRDLAATLGTTSALVQQGAAQLDHLNARVTDEMRRAADSRDTHAAEFRQALSALDDSVGTRLTALEGSWRRTLDTELRAIRAEHERHVSAVREELNALRTATRAAGEEQRRHLTALTAAHRDTLDGITGRVQTIESRLHAQQEAMGELDRRAQSDASRLTRFLAWFQGAGAMVRLRGRPE